VHSGNAVLQAKPLDQLKQFTSIPRD
jgi:hypothetical protein